MKKTVILLILFPLLLSALAGTPLRAQDTIVSGTNLRVGANNTLGFENNHRTGHAVGLNNAVYSANALTVGVNDTIDPLCGNSVALGANNRVSAMAAMAFGNKVKVSSNYGFGVGRYLRATGHTGCMVIGTGVTASGQNPSLYLENTIENSLAVGFFSTAPTLFVGPSPNNYSLGETNKTGRVAIGNVIPQAKLHIRSDKDEDAELVLEPSDSQNDHTKLILHDGLHYIKVDPDDKMEIASSGVLGIEAADISFQGGRLDLGDDSQRKLTLTPSEAPAIYCNAYRDGGIYRRHRPGSSYALEFWTDSLVMRASRNQGERGTQITNWRNALSITTDGHVTLNGQVGVNTTNTTQQYALAVNGGLVTTNGPVALSGPVTLNGPVGVNTANTTQQYALAVDGGLITTKARIQEVGDWPDRVFAPDYALTPLEELRAYVSLNRHLPGVPSEEEVTERGIDVGRMQATLLEKIEELTLYILGQQQDIERLARYNLIQRSEIDTLRKELEELRGTVRFGYDACGNRVSRTLELRQEDDGGRRGVEPAPGNLAAPAPQGDLLGGVAYTLFPNPTVGKVTLLAEGLLPEGTAALTTATGAVIEERRIADAAAEFDLGGLPAGLYLLRITSGGETHTWKVIKGE